MLSACWFLFFFIFSSLTLSRLLCCIPFLKVIQIDSNNKDRKRMNEQKKLVEKKEFASINETAILMFWHEKDIGKSNYIAS